MKKRAGRILSFIPVILWAVMIYRFSDTPAIVSTNESVAVTEVILNFMGRFVPIDPFAKAYLIMVFEPYIRKIAHMTEFGVLFLLLLPPLNIFFTKRLPRVLVALAAAFLYACSDEYHQLFVEGRSGMIQDVAIDMIGVFIAMLLYLFLVMVVFVIKTAFREWKKTR